MNLPKIRRLIVKAQAGDKKALATLVEWGQEAAVDLILASNDPVPDWARWHLQKQRSERLCANKGRGSATAKRNEARGEAVHAGVRLALGRMLEFGATADMLTVEKVQSFILRNAPERYGLKRVPCEKIIRAEMKKLK
ncbi:hypothetical protein [Pseudogulbenkiania subflava]|uniref:Uncharacterized protein n=1 Tax=Pseudogulbenkiania subflava DSM 22618 TaxID=1123014 RepID=A0A1Y6BCJ7_9NEIS|nr:hypothetical protein [Pseudogulbenkiania subflava]SMF04080.1 hypothetical protein SAMN02745746_00926 [Pseudogulbenkiania subflava DSM 22618]